MASGLGIVTINKQEHPIAGRECLAAGNPGESPDPRTAGWRKRPYHQDLRPCLLAIECESVVIRAMVGYD
jgi:hypothetical protein